MILQKIKTIDLIEISNAAKALKQRCVMLYHNRLYGLDNLNVYIIHTSVLNLSCPYPPLFFNYRMLSAFIKNLTTEEYFVVDEQDMIHTEFKAVDEKMVDTICLRCEDTNVISMVEKRDNLAQALAMQNCFLYEEPLNVTQELQTLFALRKTDGTFYYKHDFHGRKYFMTLFSGIVPLNKADKLYMNIIDNGENSFITTLIVDKKNLKITSYLSYLKV